MRFSVFALTTVPDTATTRRLFALDDLDDRPVSKVMFHRRKQQTGSSEILRWDQRAIAGLTLIRHSLDSVQMETLSLGQHSETDMLHAFYKAALTDARLVSWDGEQTLVPLIHFRTLKHEISYPAYWEACRAGTRIHLDVRSWLSPGDRDRPTIDESARMLGFPGMLGLSDQKVSDDWLRGEHASVTAYSEVIALNTYLLALRLFSVSGEMSRHDSARVQGTLRDGLKRRPGAHVTAFLDAWERA
jgi:predicted PolB exonuclease-like 3'-5' exonuclease